jgi:hypothetical protein
MKTSARSAYKLSYCQWGYRPLRPNGQLEPLPLNPALARYTTHLGRRDVDGNLWTIAFGGSGVVLSKTDHYGRLQGEYPMPYPELGCG